MSFWRKSEPTFHKISEIVAQEPGVKPRKIATILGVYQSTVIRYLPSLEEAGILLSEDEKGGLWLFGFRETYSKVFSLHA